MALTLKTKHALQSVCLHFGYSEEQEGWVSNFDDLSQVNSVAANTFLLFLFHPIWLYLPLQPNSTLPAPHTLSVMSHQSIHSYVHGTDVSYCVCLQICLLHYSCGCTLRGKILHRWQKLSLSNISFSRNRSLLPWSPHLIHNYVFIHRRFCPCPSFPSPGSSICPNLPFNEPSGSLVPH